MLIEKFNQVHMQFILTFSWVILYNGRNGNLWKTIINNGNRIHDQTV